MINAKKLREMRHTKYLEEIQQQILEAEGNGENYISWLIPEDADISEILDIIVGYDYYAAATGSGSECFLKVWW